MLGCQYLASASFVRQDEVQVWGPDRSGFIRLFQYVCVALKDSLELVTLS